MQGNPAYDGHLTDLNNAQGEAEIRNALKLVTRDAKLTPGQVQTLLQHGRAKLQLAGVAAIAEHYGKDGLTTINAEKGGGADSALTSHSATGDAPALQTAVEAEIVEEVLPIVREPALPVIEPLRLAFAMQQWQKLASVIEENTPDCLTVIEGKKWRNAEFWRAARLAYGIDRPTIEEERIDYKEGRAHIKVRVNMGRRYASAIGICERTEKGKQNAPMNSLAGIAYTRACNRASREVIGLGSKSAEEVEGDGV